jgi:REP element-mobilizing transposase RayT
VGSEAENPGLDRVRYELRADGIRDPAANPLRSGIHTRGYLPHVKREGASYFVTYRLADSLPKEVLLQLEARRARRIRALGRGDLKEGGRLVEEHRINQDFRRELERYLDAGHGSCHLKRPEIAALVVESLNYFHKQRYVLRDWVVMPNHVHVVVWPMPNFLLSGILKTWKQYTSRKAGCILKENAKHFWQQESFDHWIRDDDEHARIARYIRNNPVSACLCRRPEDWRWSSAYQAARV